MTGPVERVIAIMESLAGADDAGLTAQAIVERSGLPPSTGYRILSELQDLGLVHRLGKRRLTANYSFSRRINQPGLNPEVLADACADLSDQLTTASEIVLLREQSMLWHLVHQHPDQAIRLRAHAGYTRDAYELDSIGRLALSHLPLGAVENSWDTTSFYTTGLDRESLNWAEVRAAIGEVDPAGMQYDMMGNAKGIRRFCVAIRDSLGRMACLLTVAEAAIPLRDERAHVEKIRRLLMEKRSRIEIGPDDQEAGLHRIASSIRG